MCQSFEIRAATVTALASLRFLSRSDSVSDHAAICSNLQYFVHTLRGYTEPKRDATYQKANQEKILLTNLIDYQLIPKILKNFILERALVCHFGPSRSISVGKGSQTLTIPSWEHEAMRFVFGDQLIPFTQFACSEKQRQRVGCVKFHNITVESAELVAIVLPSGLKRTWVTGFAIIKYLIRKNDNSKTATNETPITMESILPTLTVNFLVTKSDPLAMTSLRLDIEYHYMTAYTEGNIKPLLPHFPNLRRRGWSLISHFTNS
uniref:Uncharacterized protein n=1 Tax=Glossina pallidipes TaxID=7398 RepID=A0A1A9ZBM7_GLOPL